MPAVSVIIPVYKVEPYLHRCVDSVLAQSFTDIEIILVDDGSPDNCGAICDEYAAQDARIHVIHKENGGLSSARNAGIRAAQGAYLMFVDSDDWIAPDMAKDMLQAIQENDCDMAICQYFIVRGDVVSRCTSGDQGVRVLSQKEAVSLLIEDKVITNHVWRRLYRKELFSSLRFPEGKAFEDIFIMLDLMLQCRNIAYLDQAYYYYYQNSSGIVASNTIQNVADHYEGIIHQRDTVQEVFPDLMARQSVCFFKIYIVLIKNLESAFPREMAQKEQLYRQLLDELTVAPHTVRKELNFEGRYYCFASKYPVPVFHVFFSFMRLYRRLVRKIKRVFRAIKKKLALTVQ